MGQRIYCSPSKTSIGENIKMNKQEILDEINKTKEHLANMENMLEECEDEIWKPRAGEEYYYLDFGLKIYAVKNFNYPSDIRAIKAYNCFRTKKQAELEAEKILVRRQLEDIARRLNKGRKIDWNNGNQIKYSIYFSFNKIGYIFCCHQKEQGVVYCLDTDFYKVAIQEIGEERLKAYLRGE